MTEKTEALRLADALKAATGQTDAEDDVIHVARWFVEDADAELRRLHAENAELREANETFGRRQVWWNDRMFALEQQRDALLEALKYHQEQTRPIQRSIDAIKAVEENT